MKALGIMPRRLKRQLGRHALVDGIPFALPVRSFRMQALMAAFPVDTEEARKLLPPSVSPVRLWNRTLLVITVVNYQETSIGKYIEYSVALTAAHRDSDPPRLLPLVLSGPFSFGQYVVDLPVSTEISVKGGKGIWGMPKHQANLDFVVTDDRVSGQYDKDGRLGVYVEIERPGGLRLPVSMGASNYCSFRGMLMKSNVYVRGKAEVGLARRAQGLLRIGDLPRVEPLKRLNVGERPLFTAFFPEAHGVLDDYTESWFLPYGQEPTERPEGLESVVDLGLGEEWLPPPHRG
jgi:Acetoacetate decarboxylase (ADC)